MRYFPCNLCGASGYTLIRPYPGFEGVDLVICQSCSLMQAQPVPTDEFLAKYYESSFGSDPLVGFHLTDRSERGARLRATLQLDFVRKHIPFDGRTGKILDVGCHVASFLFLFKRRGWEVAGVDPNPRSAYAEKWYGIRVIQSLFRKGMFEPNSFDAILHSHSLEHVPDPRGYLEEFHRILKPGGWVFIEVPNESRAKVASRKVIPHLYFFTPDTLRDLCERADFEVITTKVLGIGPRSSAQGERSWPEWFSLRWRAKYDARGRMNPLTLMPYFGRLFREDRYFRDFHPDGAMLRVLLRKSR